MERARCDGSAARIVDRPEIVAVLPTTVSSPVPMKISGTGRAAVELVAAGRDIAANDTAAACHNHRAAHHDRAAGIDIRRAASQVCIGRYRQHRLLRTDVYLTRLVVQSPTSCTTDCLSHRRRPGPELLHLHGTIGVGWPRSRSMRVESVQLPTVPVESNAAAPRQAAGVTLIVTVVAFEVRKPLLA